MWKNTNRLFYFLIKKLKLFEFTADVKSYIDYGQGTGEGVVQF